MRIFLFLIISVGSLCTWALSQDDTIQLTLELPKDMGTVQGMSTIAIEQLNRSNQLLNKKMQKNTCADCESVASVSQSALSFTYGNGRTFAKDPAEGGNQVWNFDLRLSKVFDEGCARIDTGLLNEGHPVNHHRDGFYLQLACSKKILQNLSMELALGGYFSMDTTTKRGIEYDEKGLNILATMALKYYINKSGLHARLECNAVKSTAILAKGPDSLLCSAGVGKDFSVSSDFSGEDFRDFSISAGPVWSKTNHGRTNAALGKSVEISKQSGSWMTRLGVLTTGNDGAINDRKGVSVDMNYMIPVGKTGKDHLYTGAGVYLARNFQSEKYEVNPTLTFLGYEHKFNKRYFVRVDYIRVARPNHAPVIKKEGDADVVRGQFGYSFD